MRPRLFVPCICLFVFSAVSIAHAHRLEPISTHFARPFAPRTGSVEMTYEYERRRHEGLRTHLIPEAEFELGIGRRMQISLEVPVIREKASGEKAVYGGGHLEIGFRYLIAGGQKKSYAISINPFVAPTTGNRRLAGDATETGLALNFDKEFGRRAFFHGNYGWSLTVGGSEERERLFFHRSALVVPITKRWNPVVEVLGTTDTASSRSELVVQPEIIFYVNRHWELKVGVPVGLTKASPGIGVRAQVAWIFGRKGSD